VSRPTWFERVAVWEDAPPTVTGVFGESEWNHGLPRWGLRINFTWGYWRVSEYTHADLVPRSVLARGLIRVVVYRLFGWLPG
jgi:hypothetical protein